MIKITHYMVPLDYVRDIRSWDHSLHSNSEKDWICFDIARNDKNFSNKYSQSSVVDVLKICKNGRNTYEFLFLEFKDLTKLETSNETSINEFFNKKRDSLIMKIIESIAITSYFLDSSKYINVRSFLSSKRKFFIVYKGGNMFHAHMGAISFLQGPRLEAHAKCLVMEWSSFCKIISPKYCK